MAKAVKTGGGFDAPALLPIGLEDILRAEAMLSGAVDYLPGQRHQIAVNTPVSFSDSFSRQLGCRVHLKLENLQTTGSYKIRGAFNNISNLDPAVRELGVVTASAGNHAQGVAYAARAFGIESRTTVFVPVGTPKVKQDNTRSYDVEIRETGENFDQARASAYEETRQSKRTFIEPFDDWNTIPGQGTIGLEILNDLPQVKGIVVPVGGGGMISGIAIASCQSGKPPSIIGVQAAGAASMLYALEMGAPVPLPCRLKPSSRMASRCGKPACDLSRWRGMSSARSISSPSPSPIPPSSQRLPI